MSPFPPSINELALTFATESHPEVNQDTREVIPNKFLDIIVRASPHSPAEIAAKAACEILAYYYNACPPLLGDLESDMETIQVRIQNFCQKVQNVQP